MELFTRTEERVAWDEAPTVPSPDIEETAQRSDRERPGQTDLGDPTTGRWGTVAALVTGDVVGLVALLGVVLAAAGWMGPEMSGQIGPVFAVLVPALVSAFALSGFYQARFFHPALEMKRMVLIVGMIAGTAVLSGVLFAADPAVVQLVAIGGVAGTVLLPLCRVTTRVLCARFSWWGVPAVVVDFGDDGDNIIDTLNRWPEIGLRPVAWLSNADEGPSTSIANGDPDRAPSLAQTFGIPYAIVSMPDHAHSGRAKRLAHYTKFFDHVFRVGRGDAPVFWSTGRSGEGLRGYGVGNAASSAVTQGLKRTVDLLCAVSLLVLLAPLFVTIAGLIRLESEGPVFFRQERMGKGGEIFTLLKFRSMYSDAEERLQKVLEADPQRRREYETYHKLRDDPRVTPMGKLLRASSLDEFPQLLNVVRGEMSLIGPRAYMPGELPDMNGLETVILQTPPGVTGLWQVSGRNQLAFEERVELDVHYVQNWSLWLDLYLLVRTVPTVLMREGAA
jgi:Undecaprenyl-phosphate galactose phosphotransferase WbaP